MPRAALALATLLTLTLNGSLAVASSPVTNCKTEAVCTLWLPAAPPALPVATPTPGQR